MFFALYFILTHFLLFILPTSLKSVPKDIYDKNMSECYTSYKIFISLMIATIIILVLRKMKSPEI